FCFGGGFSGLCFFGFFHGLLGFFRLLGTGFGTLLTLFFLQLLAAQQLDESLVGAVTFLPSATDDASVSAVAVAKTRANRVEQLAHRLVRHQVGSRLATHPPVSALTERNQLFEARAEGLRFPNCGLYATAEH